ncbi:MAG: haloacid dehalogenase-like hydrolase, partial [Pseudomonadota bacterium]
PRMPPAPRQFSAEVNAKAKADGADGMIVYMLLMYRKARQKGIEINREELVALGADVELFDGVEAWFDEIDAYVDTIAGSAFSVRHYLISSGLTEIVEGTSIYPRFANVFASEYFFEPYETPFPKRVVTDTNKTQYLFRINKGIEDLGISINEHMPESERPVPFANMIYFGDGDTDVPSMAVTRQNGGAAVAVFPPDGSDAKCRTLYEASRVDFFAAADYRAGSDLFRRTCLLLDRIVADIRVKQERHTLEQS